MSDELAFKTPEAFERWLAKNCSSSDGIWLRVDKSAGANMLKNPEVIDILLCYGWITGQARRGDEKSVLWWVCPRRKRSLWSLLNKRHAERLIREGRMKPEGMARIEEAKRDGRWAMAYSPQRTARVPQDFIRELDKDKAAREFFGTLDRTNRYAIIFRLRNAGRGRREGKIAEIIRMLREKRTFHRGR